MHKHMGDMHNKEPKAWHSEYVNMHALESDMRSYENMRLWLEDDCVIPRQGSHGL